MKKITTTRKANRRPARERKNPSGVQNQLSGRRSNTASKKSSAKPNMNTTLEQDVNEETALAVAQEPKNSKAEFTRGELGKAKRAFANAGQPDASEEIRKKWLAEMKALHIDVMRHSSPRLAKVIKGDLSVVALRK